MAEAAAPAPVTAPEPIFNAIDKARSADIKGAWERASAKVDPQAPAEPEAPKAPEAEVAEPEPEKPAKPNASNPSTKPGVIAGLDNMKRGG